MVFAIATDGKYVSPHFGRCQIYTIVEIENGQIIRNEKVVNPGHEPGVIPEFLNKKGARKVICGGIGDRAIELFRQYEIEILAGIQGTVENVIEDLKKGMLIGKESMCKPGDGRGYGIEKTECDHANEEK
jgi:predicted Fe-Mo cluster-binding NifX family protein